MARSRTTDTAEFKRAAVKRITDRKRPVAEVARRLAVRETLLRDWWKAVPARGDAAFPGHLPPAEDELRRLRAEVVRLKAERNLLKKSRRVLRPSAEWTLAFVADHAAEWPVAWRCEAREVSASGYYAWAAAPTARPSAGDTSWLRPSRPSMPTCGRGTAARG